MDRTVVKRTTMRRQRAAMPETRSEKPGRRGGRGRKAAASALPQPANDQMGAEPSGDGFPADADLPMGDVGEFSESLTVLADGAEPLEEHPASVLETSE